MVTKNCWGDSVYAGNPAQRIMLLDEYVERLRNKFLKDAQTNILQIIKRNNGNVQERQMRNYEFLYLERTNRNEQQINSQSWIGCDKMKIIDLFRSTSPLDGVRDFSDFEKYLSDLEDNERDRLYVYSFELYIRVSVWT